MVFVLDTSVTMTWCFVDEATPYGDRVLEGLRADAALTPAIWPLEVANALRVGERRGRLQPGRIPPFLELIGGLPIAVDAGGIDMALGQVLDLARKLDLSSYDASYLELALREGIPLATQDARLRSAARRVGVPLVG